MTFGYLGVMVHESEVWTFERENPSRYLGPLKGARAGLTEPRRSRIGMFISGLLLGEVVPKKAIIFIAFSDDTRHERLVVPWINRWDWPKIATEIGRFNLAAAAA